jgi:hypothetical protein
VKVTEQLVTPVVADNVQVVELREPPVLPEVRVNVTVPVGALVAAVVSATIATTLAEQLLPPNAIVQLTAPTIVDVLSFPVVVTVTATPELVLVLCEASPPYVAVTMPDPALVPVNMTEQLLPERLPESAQVVALSDPPVVPGVNEKVTVPVGVFVGVVVSTTVAVTAVVQLDAPRAMLQVTAGMLVKALSFGVADTVTVAEALVLALWVVSPP